MMEDQLRQGRVDGISMAAKKIQKKKRGRTTTAAAAIPATLFRSVTDMGVTAISSGSVLLCLFAAKRLL